MLAPDSLSPPKKWLSAASSALQTIPHFFSTEECDRILSHSTPHLRQVGLIKQQSNDDIRRSSVAWLEDEGPMDWVMQKIMRLVSEVNGRHFEFTLTDFLEHIQIAQYSSDNAGHYDWHTDLGSSQTASKRKLTLVAQLSDPSQYSGGLLELNIGGRIYQASLEQGACFLFPAFVVHRVTPVTDGIRRSLACWVHGPTFS